MAILGTMKNRAATIDTRTSGIERSGRSPGVCSSAPHLSLLGALLALALSAFSTAAQTSREYQLKAVFLFNFAQFTEWPSNAFAGEKSPIIIGVVGTNPFGTALEDTVRGETVQGRPLEVQHYSGADEIKTCHILFISASETHRMEEIVKRTRGKPVLTVADADGPAMRDVMIRFVVTNNKVHFRINQEAAQAVNLTLSSRLLRVAESPPGGGP
jgi:hypothetical protein